MIRPCFSVDLKSVNFTIIFIFLIGSIERLNVTFFNFTLLFKITANSGYSYDCFNDTIRDAFAFVN